MSSKESDVARTLRVTGHVDEHSFAVVANQCATLESDSSTPSAGQKPPWRTTLCGCAIRRLAAATRAAPLLAMTKTHSNSPASLT
jgi:hypothetical protein